MLIEMTRNGVLVAQVETPGRDPDMTTALRYIVDAHEDEPLLVIRGRDRFAIATAASYMRRARACDAIVAEDRGRDALERVLHWQNANYNLVKIPD